MHFDIKSSFFPFYLLTKSETDKKIVKTQFDEKNCENVLVLYCFVVDNFDLTRKIVNFFSWEKNRENVLVLHCFVVNNFDLTRKIVNFFS